MAREEIDKHHTVCITVTSVSTNENSAEGHRLDFGESPNVPFVHTYLLMCGISQTAEGGPYSYAKQWLRQRPVARDKPTQLRSKVQSLQTLYMY
jgi:hypothetical protein